MKYWLLTTEYPPHYGGGIGTYCAQWSSILEENGIELSVFILNKKEKTFRETTQNNIRRIDFSPYLKNTSRFLGYETMVSSSFEEIIRIYIEKEGPPDGLEAQEYQGIAYFLLQKKHLGEALYKNLKVLVTCHCPSFITFEHNHIDKFQLPYFWIAEMERFCMKAADVCIFPSKYLAHDILRRYPSLIDNYFVLHNPFRVEEHTSPGNIKIQNDVVIIGKLSPAKGTLNALRVFVNLWRKGYNYKLKLVGDDNYFYHAANATTGDYLKKKYLSYLASELLIIAGALPQTQVKEEIKKSRIVLVPSTVENFPYTVIEAMAAGKIVLASKEGGQNEIIRDGENGFLFDPNQSSSLEEKIHVICSLENEVINRITGEAVNTIKEECNPQAYFERKMNLLKQHKVQRENIFPFCTSFSNEEMANGQINAENSTLSVIVPYYNMGKYVHETIASIDASTYQDKEIIIINDGSTEEGSCRALELLKGRPDVKIIDQQNQGLPTARNRGVVEAKGRYIAFLDPDDIVDKDYYQKAITILQQKMNVHFVGCWVQYFDGSTGRWPALNPEPPLLLYHNMTNSSSLVHRKDSFLKSGLYDPAFVYGMEDYDSVVTLVKKGYRGVIIPEFLFFYRVRKNSMVRKFNDSIRLYLQQLLAEKHKEFYATFATELFGLVNANGPGMYVDNPTLDYHLAKKIPFAGSLSKKLISLIKKNELTRKIAYKIYRLLNK